MTPEVQKQLFEMALDEIRQQGITDLMNQVLELEFDELTQCVRVNRYEAPEHSPPG